MPFDHFQNLSLTHGGSPGNGTTPILMSRAPLATEGEATPGPDDVNPYDQEEYEVAMEAQQRQADSLPPSMELRLPEHKLPEVDFP